MRGGSSDVSSLSSTTRAIAAGLPMQSVEMIETGALDAYASGLHPSGATIAVTHRLV